MKKIIVTFCAILSIMVFIASPLFIKPIKTYAAYKSIDECRGNMYTSSSYPYYIYFTAHFADCNNDGVSDDESDVTYCLFFPYNYDFTSFIDNGGGSYSLNTMYSVGGYAFNSRTNQQLTNAISWNSMSFGTDFITFYDSLGNEYNPYYSRLGYRGSFTLHLETNIESIVFDDFNVIVTFNPELIGHVTRPNITDNGTSRPSEIFNMTVENRCPYGIQFRMDINKYDGSVSELQYFEPQWSNGFSARGSYGFVFVNDEWIYVQPEQTGGIIKTLKSSEWHYVGQGETFSQNFSWSQFNLEANQAYVVRVVAVKNNVGCATALNANRGNFGEDYPNYCIDYSEAQFVYNNVFDVVNPATYNPNDTSFGNKILHNNFDSTDKNKVSAYEDTATGNVVISNADTSKDFRDILGAPTNGGSHGGGGYYTGSNSYNNSFNGVSGNSFNNLNTYFSNFFGFCNNALSAFPAIFLTIISAGLAGLVVIGIVKAAIK